MVSGALPAPHAPTTQILEKQQSEKMTAIVCICSWVTISCIVIVLNKWILDRFPFSITLTTWHMLFATISTQVLSRTTNLIDTSVKVNARFYITKIVPISICFSISLICSNMVYLYLSMSFIQMLKAMGPVATLLACWSIGLRNPEPSMRVFLTVLVIVGGVMISSLGELKFVALGVLIQAAGVASEAYKNALQQILLTGKMKMSSLTLLYYFAPACTIMNIFCIIVFEARDLRNSKVSSINPMVFLVNGIFTFGLNIASVATIKKTSSLVLTLCGIPKAMLLVGLDMALYRTPLTWMQAGGFAIAGMGTYHYSHLNDSNASSPKICQPDEKKGLHVVFDDEESFTNSGSGNSEKRED